jgi:hypothetical protein
MQLTPFPETFGFTGTSNLFKGEGVVLREPTVLQTAKLKNPARANNKTNTELWRLFRK